MAKLSTIERFALAVRSFFRILGERGFAERVNGLTANAPAIVHELAEAGHPSEPPRNEREPEPVTPAPTRPAAPAEHAALQLLNLLQREGRLVDFLQQDVTGFSDVQIGQAARVVHEGCRATLRRYAAIEPVLAEREGEPVSVAEGFDPRAIKLLGNVSGRPPFRGILRHQGWRVSRLDLPETVGEHDFFVVAPAEVEL